MRKIAVFTGTRAEYGLLSGVIARLRSNPDCLPQLIVSGTHLSPEHGYTINQITHDGLAPAAGIPLDLKDNSPAGICRAMGKALGEYAEQLHRLSPDLIVLLGDRYETFAMACAAHMLRLPIAHLHGGELTLGAVDDAFRHSITKMSHLHFASCEIHRERVIQLGEDPERVFNVGSLGVENCRALELASEREIRSELQLEAKIPYLVCTMHPVTLDKASPQEQVQPLLQALNQFPDQAVIFTGANADPGGDSINAILQEYVKKRQNARFFMSLGQKLYFSAVRYAACVLGNSSSGIIEVPSLGRAVVDIGNRQKGRVRAKTVLHAEQTEAAITKALAAALSPAYRQDSLHADNPYDKKGTARQIVEHVLSAPLENILNKNFFTLNRPV